MNHSIELAPLHGVTGHVFRNAWLRHFSGLDSAMAPFIASIRSEASFEQGKRNHFRDVLPENNGELPLVPQVMSNDPESFSETAGTLADLGYAEVNWNLGCPSPMVTRKKRGSGLLPHPDFIASFLEAALPKISVAVSVKVRLGLDDPTELLRLMPILNGFPLGRVVIHPRIGTQMYSGTVDLDRFSDAYALCKHPVTYNGDVSSPGKFASLRERFPRIHGWMIGRWLVSDPFLAEDIKGIARPGDRLERVRSFHDDLYCRYREVLFGPSHVLDKAKEFWRYVGLSISGADRPLRNIARAKTLPEYEKNAARVFGEGKWAPPDDR